jgi:peptidoglycan/LPS O-acetylase OafA/YrhL
MSGGHALKAERAFSTYLDAVRFSAALFVVLEHAVRLGLLQPLGILTELSHESVVIFFVLSGLVIASSSRGATPGAYFAARAARVYSVAVPALACCYVAALVAAYASGTAPAVGGPGLLSSALFLDGVWTNYNEVPFNGPYWSLCYEVWYYALWAALLFIRRPVGRLIAAAALLAVMGPAMAALAGVWLIGALAARPVSLRASATTRPGRIVIAVVCALGSAIAIVWLASSGIEDRVRLSLIERVPAWWRMRGAEYLFTDYAIATLVAVHLIAARVVLRRAFDRADLFVCRAVRYAAGFTFTLYLFHYPLLLLARAMEASGIRLSGPLVLAVVFCGCWLIGFVTDAQLPRWRRAIRALGGIHSALLLPDPFPHSSRG